MSNYLPRASKRMRPDISLSMSESLRTLMTETIQTLTAQNSSLVAVESNSRFLSRMLQRLPQSRLLNLKEMIPELELIPVAIRRVKRYSKPIVKYFDNFAVVRNYRGEVTEIIKIIDE